MKKGRPKGTVTGQMERVYIRLPAEEITQRKREAKAMGISLSAYLRLFIRGPAITATQQTKG